MTSAGSALTELTRAPLPTPSPDLGPHPKPTRHPGAKPSEPGPSQPLSSSLVQERDLAEVSQGLDLIMHPLAQKEAQKVTKRAKAKTAEKA